MKMLNIHFQHKEFCPASPTFESVLHFVVTESMTFQKMSGRKMATDLRRVRQREFHSLVACGPAQVETFLLRVHHERLRHIVVQLLPLLST